MIHGFFDVDERLAKISQSGDPLEALADTVDFEIFRPVLEKAVPRADQGAVPSRRCAITTLAVWWRRRPVGKRKNAMARFIAILLIGLVLGGGRAALAGDHPENADAQFEAGARAYEAKGYRKAREIWLPLAHAGHAGAQFKMGVLYGFGRLGSKDHAAAREWYEKSAEQGYAKAQYNLAIMYERGDGVAVDYQKASRLYELAGHQGHVSSQYALGVKYLDAIGVPRNLKQADYWLTQAAEQGDRTAQLELGRLWRNSDREKSHYWFWKAADQGNRAALVMLATDGDPKAEERQTWFDFFCVHFVQITLNQPGNNCDW